MKILVMLYFIVMKWVSLVLIIIIYNLDNNFDEDDPDTIILRLLAWHIKFEKCKALKKKVSEELMPIAWHPKRWWNFCISEDEKKEKITE